MIKVRFNLSMGPRYQTWKVEFESGMVEYLEPSRVCLVMRDCTLRNRKASAQKIFEGHDKFVCAWIECESIQIDPPLEVDGTLVKYNPRVQPNWLIANQIADGAKIPELLTHNRNVLIKHT